MTIIENISCSIQIVVRAIGVVAKLEVYVDVEHADYYQGQAEYNSPNYKESVKILRIVLNISG